MENQATAHAEPNVTTYVVGFAFRENKLFGSKDMEVCLIEKQKPDWQRGLLNGVGGKLEPGEDPLVAMAREFFEETGVHTMPSSWLKFFVMRFNNGAIVHCFTTTIGTFEQPRTMEAEFVDMYRVRPFGSLPSGMNTVPNLHWLVPMAYRELHSPPQERMIVAD